MKIEAAVLREGASVPVLETVDIEEPRASEILVRVVATGICHTDIAMQWRSGPRPIVLGHEGAGVVERVGAGVSELEPGDHVVLSSNFCGHCPACLRNAQTYCYELMPRNFGGLRMDGTSSLSKNGALVFGRFFGQSSFATFALADERSAVKVPRDLPLEILGPLGCGVQTGAGAVINSFKVAPGRSIAIFGAGSVGLSAVMAAGLVGASRIIAVDRVPQRLALAKELGASDVIDTSSGDAAKIILELTRFGVDFSLNTTSSPAVYKQAIDCLGQQGVAGFVTAPRGDFAPDMSDLLTGGKSLRGIVGGDSTPRLFIPLLIDYFRQGRFPFDRLIKFYPFEKIGAAFEDSKSGVTVKPVLRMGDTHGT
jgi:aryl-alcohol dehydrogenase